MPPAREVKTHIALADLIRKTIKPKWVWFHPPNGGEREHDIDDEGNRYSKEGGLLKRMGTRPGVSDFIFAAPPAAQMHVLELKRKGYRPTNLQFAFLADVEAAGGRSAWADSFNAAAEILMAWGAIRKIETWESKP